MAIAHKMRRPVRVVLILGALEGFFSQVIQVFQPPQIFANPGSDVVLPCTYNVSEEEKLSVGSYKWYRHLVKPGLEVSDSNKDFTGRISRVDTEQFTKTRSAHLTIRNVIDTDAGSYYCEVTFLHGGGISGHGGGISGHGGGISGHGDGTLLNVTDMPENKTPSPLSISLGAVSVVVVLLFVVVGYYKISKQGSRQNAPRGQEMLQNVEPSPYMMENQQYNLFLPNQAPLKPVPPAYQELDLYSIIP